MRGQFQADGFHHLRFDGQDDHIGALNGLGVAGEGVDGVFGADPGALLGAMVAGAHAAGVDALGAQPADQAGGHIAGADKRNTGGSHKRVPYLSSRVERRL
ncbi:hypothetical protein D9M68_1001510 [compost metagenome]